MQYRHTAKDVRSIGAELGVAYVLDGSVRRAGARLRVTAQLVQTSDGTHIWADTYEQDLTDVIEIQTGSDSRWLACDPYTWRPIAEPSHRSGQPLSAATVYQHLADQRPAR